MYDPQSAIPGVETYRSHKLVRAAKITHVYGAMCVGVGPEKRSVIYDPRNKPIPEVGMYVVFYDNGYISFSPAKAFELGYSPAA